MTPNMTSDTKPACSDMNRRHDETTKAPIVDSESLFRGSNEIVIRHHGADYRMKITRQGKLILNK